MISLRQGLGRQPHRFPIAKRLKKESSQGAKRYLTVDFQQNERGAPPLDGDAPFAHVRGCVSCVSRAHTGIYVLQQAEQKPQPQPEPWHRRQSRLRLTMVTTVGAQEHVSLTQPPQTGPVIVEMNSFGQAKSSSIR